VPLATGRTKVTVSRSEEKRAIDVAMIVGAGIQLFTLLCGLVHGTNRQLLFTAECGWTGRREVVVLRGVREKEIGNVRLSQPVLYSCLQSGMFLSSCNAGIESFLAVLCLRSPPFLVPSQIRQNSNIHKSLTCELPPPPIVNSSYHSTRGRSSSRTSVT
jgi:hypothetical protein